MIKEKVNIITLTSGLDREYVEKLETNNFQNEFYTLKSVISPQFKVIDEKESGKIIQLPKGSYLSYGRTKLNDEQAIIQECIFGEQGKVVNYILTHQYNQNGIIPEIFFMEMIEWKGINWNETARIAYKKGDFLRPVIILPTENLERTIEIETKYQNYGTKKIKK